MTMKKRTKTISKADLVTLLSAAWIKEHITIWCKLNARQRSAVALRVRQIIEEELHAKN
jgi:hypothetical protein